MITSGKDIQPEGSTTGIHYAILELLAAANLTGGELRCLLFVLRKTYGWQKKSDELSYGQIVKATGLSRRGVINSIQSLIDKRILSVAETRLGRNGCRAYTFNKYFEQWQDKTITGKPESINAKKIGEPECTDSKVNGEPECTDSNVNGEPECTITVLNGEPECTDSNVNGEPECTINVLNGEPECTDSKINGEPECTINVLNGELQFTRNGEPECTHNTIDTKRSTVRSFIQSSLAEGSEKAAKAKPTTDGRKTSTSAEKDQRNAIADRLTEVGVTPSPYLLGKYSAAAAEQGLDAVLSGIAAAAEHGKQHKLSYVMACVRDHSTRHSTGPPEAPPEGPTLADGRLITYQNGNYVLNDEELAALMRDEPDNDRTR